ncbi:MAG: methylmalonyl-CoA mutase family protein, partial [Candidatus Bathyarchaeota archaeon]|nr:methylmalonyl-CoA mutase family protein [Candidatus Bathyarchaeota archaeon]
SAYRYQKEIESSEKVVVGVNEFTTEEKTPIPILRVDPAVENRQNERLNRMKGKRNNAKVNSALDKLRHVAEGDENLMPVIFEAVKAYASLGEICGVLREVFGEYRAPTIF